MKIPITRVWTDETELRVVRDPLMSGWLTQGIHVAGFEQAIADYADCKSAIATTSCTTALHVALRAVGIGPGDQVIVPAFTWVATANAVEYCGAMPVFCDIDLNTYNIDVRQVERKISSMTRAVIPVHLFGCSADMEPLLQLARRHKLRIIEDAACGLGTYYYGRHVGSLGDAGCFSFHPRKVLTTGEGGMVVTDCQDIEKKVRSLRDHGTVYTAESGSPSDMGDVLYLGFNYRLTDIQAAIGLAQMKKLSDILSLRKRLAARYDELLSDSAWLVTPAVPDNSVHSYQAYVCLYRPEDPGFDNIETLSDERNQLMMKLAELGVATRPGTHAVTRLSYYRKKYHLSREDFPNALFAESLSIALPLYPQMTDSEQDYVVRSLFNAYQSVRC